MKTADDILQEIENRENHPFFANEKRRKVTIEAMESYASQLVEAEKKRAHCGKTGKDFLKSKIGFYNPFHPVQGVDYDEVEKWLDEFASQSVETERKRIHDNPSDMDLESEAEKWYYSVYNRKRPLFFLSEQQSTKQFFKVMAYFARTILSRNESINPPKTETNETD